MFCPWCGALTEVREGRLCSTATAMEFSEAARRGLAAVAETPAAEPQPSGVRWGGSWHCPADASLMIEVDGHVTCPTCDRSLPPRLLCSLVEFHVHPRLGR
jgi:uncharacterized Zn finger protein (UPF0148 family)